MTVDPRNPRARIVGTGRYVPVGAGAPAGSPDEGGPPGLALAGAEQGAAAAPAETTSDIAVRAATAALAAAGIGPRDLDMIIVATSSGDVPMPATAVSVQQKLGAELIPSFDLSASLAGFLFGLSVANQFVSAGTMKHVLVIGADMLSRLVDPRDAAAAQLFGDGAGAAVVGPALGDRRGILRVDLHADGSRADVLQVPGGGSAEPLTAERLAARRHTLHVKPPELMQAVQERLGAQAAETLEAAGLSRAELDWIIPHRADGDLAACLVDRLGCPPQRILGARSGAGRAGAGSVAIALDEALRDGRVAPGHTVLLCALGGGVAWGGALLRM